MPELELVADGVSDRAWYALHTRFQHEKNVAGALTGKGFEVFLPLYTAIHRWKDRNKQLMLPLFSCYVFVQNPLDRWQPILATPGIHNVVGVGGRPSIIPSPEIEAIQRMVEGRFKAEPHPFLTCGDRVRFTSGPMWGLEGILLRKKSLWKLVVSVDMLQRAVAVEVDASVLEHAYGQRSGFSPPALSMRARAG